jgi:hypothetical protein
MRCLPRQLRPGVDCPKHLTLASRTDRGRPRLLAGAFAAVVMAFGVGAIPLAGVPRVSADEERGKDPVFPGIGGWVVLPDGETLIVALPERAELAYVDTVAHKELKRVTLPFKPDHLAVQGDLLCVSVQGGSEIHILGAHDGTPKRQVRLPGSVEDMVCQPGRKVAVLTTNPGTAFGNRIFGLDAATGAIAVAGDLASGREELRANPQMVGPGRLYKVTLVPMAAGGRLLALSPTGEGALYTAYEASSGRHPETHMDSLRLAKFAVAGKFEINRVPPKWQGNLDARPFDNPRALPLGPFWALMRLGEVLVAASGNGEVSARALHLSRDGRRVAVLSAGEVHVFATDDVAARDGRVNCPNTTDFAFHPGLDLLAAERDDGKEIVLFDAGSLVRSRAIELDRNEKLHPVAGHLLTFGARGTRLIYYDHRRGGRLRSLPLDLSPAQREALAKAYHTHGWPLHVAGAIEGEDMKVLASSGDFAIAAQDMAGFPDGQWSGARQLFAHGGKAGGWADLELSAPADGTYQVNAYLTRAGDYGVIRFLINNAPAGAPIDGFDADRVISTGAIALGDAALKKGVNTLRVEVVRSDPKSAEPHYSWGLDCVTLKGVR